MAEIDGFLYVATCPLSVLRLCTWHTEPAPSETIAIEALRAHVSSHHHGDLVAFAAAHAEALVRYVRSEVP